MSLRKTLCLSLFAAARAAAAPAAQAKRAHGLPPGAPSKLSDLYKFFTAALRQGLGAEVQTGNIRILGRSWELIDSAVFPEVEVPLKPFKVQGLSIEKAELLFRHLELDKDALVRWELKPKAVREVQSRFIVSLRSLQAKLSQLSGGELKLAVDVGEQVVELSGPGSFAGIACATSLKLRPRWDEAARQLFLDPVEKSYGGRRVPRWLWRLGKDAAPKGPVLDFAGSWIPFNIQEVHLGWDRLNLSTNW
jgi:hypothetical protein